MTELVITDVRGKVYLIVEGMGQNLIDVSKVISLTVQPLAIFDKLRPKEVSEELIGTVAKITGAGHLVSLHLSQLGSN